ncbi:serine hydrolase domain-containing protein [Plantactinospora sp. GCM10030261]|uniref:serine hydrolase domain-containing protein n=1 Tax=Plantactinospora sp. GCM10030261 TaxID=3273420 RepID=UPI00361D8C0E
MTVDPPHRHVDTRDVQAILDDFLKSVDVPGVAVSLFTSKGVTVRAARGVSSIESPDTAMTPTTVGVVHSLSKVMTGTAAGVLVARGHADIDEPITRHLPDVPGRDRFAHTTLRHLLSHSAGIVRGPVPLLSEATWRDPLEQYVLGACLGAPRFAEPGQVFGYSELGIVVAGYVIQRIMRKPFVQAMRELLFEPAGMRRTTLDPFAAMTFPLCQQHVATPSGRLAVRRRFDANLMTAPSSGAFSCVEDLARLGVVHLGGDPGNRGRPLLTATAARQLHEPCVDVGLDIVRGYGMAIAIGPRYGNALSVGHEGHYDGNWSKLQLIPDLGIGAAWLDNRGEDPALRPRRQKYFDQLLHLLGAGRRSWLRDNGLGSTPDLAVAAEAAVAAGIYGRPAGRTITISAEANGLRVTDGVASVRYTHLAGHVYVAPTGAPNHIPWAPDPDSTRSTLSIVGSAQTPTHVLLNGLPYQRLGQH